MNQILGSSLVVLFFVTSRVLGNDDDASIGKDELVALNRDGFARQNPNDDLTGGFLAAWPVVLYILAATCLIISVFGFLTYAIGICRRPKYSLQSVEA